MGPVRAVRRRRRPAVELRHGHRPLRRGVARRARRRDRGGPAPADLLEDRLRPAPGICLRPARHRRDDAARRVRDVLEHAIDGYRVVEGAESAVSAGAAAHESDTVRPRPDLRELRGAADAADRRQLALELRPELPRRLRAPVVVERAAAARDELHGGGRVRRGARASAGDDGRRESGACDARRDESKREPPVLRGQSGARRRRPVAEPGDAGLPRAADPRRPPVRWRDVVLGVLHLWQGHRSVVGHRRRQHLSQPVRFSATTAAPPTTTSRMS